MTPVPEPVAAARTGLLVLGVGNDLRQDDGVGLWLARQLQRDGTKGLEVEELAELDLSLAPRLACCSQLFVLDATVEKAAAPFRVVPLAAAETLTPPRGFASHLFDWGLLLATARELYGRAPHADLVAVAGESFGFGESLSPACLRNAELALAYLRDTLSRAEAP